MKKIFLFYKHITNLSFATLKLARGILFSHYFVMLNFHENKNSCFGLSVHLYFVKIQSTFCLYLQIDLASFQLNFYTLIQGSYLICKPPHKLQSWSLDVIILLKGQYATYRTEYIFRKSHVTKLMKPLPNFIYQWISQCELHIHTMSGSL